MMSDRRPSKPERPRWYMMASSWRGPMGIAQGRIKEDRVELPEPILRLAQDEYDRQFPGQPYERMQERGGLGVLEIVRLLADALERVSDPVAAVRRGVESGTIKGMEEQCPWCAGEGTWEDMNPLPGYSPGPAPMECPYCRGIGTVLVIPFSDGGSET